MRRRRAPRDRSIGNRSPAGPDKRSPRARVLTYVERTSSPNLVRIGPMILVSILSLVTPCSAVADGATHVPGCVLWLDGSDPDGDGVAGGAFVAGTTWIDRSGSGADAVQNAAQRLPQVVPGAWNGRSIVRFDGSDFMDIASTGFGMLNAVGGATLFAVASTPVADNNQRVVMISNGANSAQSRAGLAMFDQFGTSIGGSGDYGAAGRRLDSDGFQRIEGGSISLGSLQQFAATFDYAAGAVSLHVAGALVTQASNFQSPGSTSPTDSANIRLGADAALNALRGEFTGDLAEVVVFDRVLTATERGAVEQYLHTKWFAADVGQSYCAPSVPNSGGASAVLRAAGSDVAANNDVTLIAEALPQNSFGYFIASQSAAFVPMPGGSQGNLCLGGSIGRYFAAVASSGDDGCLQLTLDLTAVPQPNGFASVAPGDTWNFQAWFRDSVGGAATSNFTDGLGIDFL